jgi:hypothetical protein
MRIHQCPDHQRRGTRQVFEIPWYFSKVALALFVGFLLDIVQVSVVEELGWSSEQFLK